MPKCRWLIALPVALALGACADTLAGPPPVDLERLAPILADLQLAEALTNEVPVLLRDSMREVFYDKVLEEYGSNQTEFDSLMWIVRQEPGWVDSLYTRVGTILARESVN